MKSIFMNETAGVENETTSEKSWQDLDETTRVVLYTMNFVVVSTAVGVFGICTNIINITVFLKQGLNSTINISLFSIAVSDLSGLILLQWACIGLNPWFQDLDLSMNADEVVYLTAGWPQRCISRITALTTVYLTVERCLCITVPLKVKQLLTPTRTTVVIFFIYIINILTMIPEYITLYLDWQVDPESNETVLALVYSDGSSDTEGVSFIIQAAMSVLSFDLLISSTAVLVWRLRRQNKLRRRMVSDQRSSAAAMSTRENRIVKMVLSIASLLVICYMPGSILFCTTFFVPEFSMQSRYPKMFVACWSFAFAAETINSSVNIFFYYRMSSRYRTTFQQLPCFSHRCRWQRNDSSGGVTTITNTRAQ